MSLLELVNSRKRRHERPPHQQYFGHMSYYLALASRLGLISSRGSTAASGAISHISPMPHEHAAFLHPIQLPGCRSIALRRKFRALEGPTGGRWKWRLLSPASFHPSSFQSVFQTTDASLLPPSLSSRTSEYCEGPQTTLLGATSSTSPPRRLLAPELDTPRCRSSVKETALAIGDAATEPPSPCRRTVPSTGPRSCHCTVAAIIGASSADFSQRRGRPPADQPSAPRGAWNRQLLKGSGFPAPATSSPTARLTLQPPHDAYQFAFLVTSARNVRDHFRKAGGHFLGYLIRAAMARLSSKGCFQTLRTLPAGTGSSAPRM